MQENFNKNIGKLIIFKNTQFLNVFVQKRNNLAM